MREGGVGGGVIKGNGEDTRGETRENKIEAEIVRASHLEPSHRDVIPAERRVDVLEDVPGVHALQKLAVTAGNNGTGGDGSSHHPETSRTAKGKLMERDQATASQREPEPDKSWESRARHTPWAPQQARLQKKRIPIHSLIYSHSFGAAPAVSSNTHRVGTAPIRGESRRSTISSQIY